MPGMAERSAAADLRGAGLVMIFVGVRLTPMFQHLSPNDNDKIALTSKVLMRFSTSR
jgi:hypothetical protein